MYQIVFCLSSMVSLIALLAVAFCIDTILNYEKYKEDEWWLGGTDYDKD